MSVPLTTDEMIRLIRRIADGKMLLPESEVHYPMMIQLAQHAIREIDDEDIPVSDKMIKYILSVLMWWGDVRDEDA